MKKLVGVFALAALCFAGIASADSYVNGYYRSNGSYVQGHNRSDSNGTVRDNYSYKGNTNPYTGKTGSNYYRNNSSSDYYGTQPKQRSNNNSYNW